MSQDIRIKEYYRLKSVHEKLKWFTRRLLKAHQIVSTLSLEPIDKGTKDSICLHIGAAGAYMEEAKKWWDEEVTEELWRVRDD